MTLMSTSGKSARRQEIVVNGIRIYNTFFDDDACIYASSPDILQDCLNTLSDYCRRWKLYLSIPKTKILIIGGNEEDRRFNFTYEGENIVWGIEEG